MARLTKRVVEAAVLGDAEFIWCGDLPGFGVRILPSGKRSYLLQYRADGKSRRATIGLHGRITTDEARKEAMMLLSQVVKSGDPAENRKTRRQSMTAAELCERYIAAAKEGDALGKRGAKTATTLPMDRSRIGAQILPLLGNKRVRDLTRADVSRFIRDVTEGKTARDAKTKRRGRSIVDEGTGAATRTAGLLDGIVSSAVTEGVIPANPALGVRQPGYKRRTKRLTPEHYKALARRCGRRRRSGETIARSAWCGSWR